MASHSALDSTLRTVARAGIQLVRWTAYRTGAKARRPECAATLTVYVSSAGRRDAV